jgi:sarcosine oxidase subunit beta
MRDHFTPPCDVDAIVIGAGIIGASCAYHLAARGLRVAILEAMSAPAEGSTGRSFAAVRAQWTDAVNIELSWRSIKAYAEFEKRHGIDIGYRAEGYMFLIPEKHWDEHKEAVALQRSLGAPISVLTVEQARAITPFNPEGIACATLGEADGRVDAHLVTDAYLQLARQFDVPLLLRQPVSAVRYDGHRWHLESPRFRASARFVVNAAGGWAGEVAALAGMELPVHHERHNIYSTALMLDAPRCPMTVDLGSGAFVRTDGHRLLYSATRTDESRGYVNTVDWAWMEIALEKACSRFPWLADMPLDRSACWAGCYEVTPDHMPVLGTVPDFPGWINACGFSGHGVMQAPEVGRLVAEQVTEGAMSTVNVESLGLQRFSTDVEAPTILVV